MIGFPQEPGWRAGPHSETSRAGAESQREKAPKMLDRIIESLRRDGDASPEQLHERLARQGVRSLLTSVRARVCQLHKQGRVVATGRYGLGESGTCKVIIWRLATPEELSLFLAQKAAADEHGEAAHG